MTVENQLQEAADKATQASAQADAWANGPINTTVPTDSGPVPTIAEFNRAAQARVDESIEAIGWVLAGDFTAGCTVTDRNQYVLVVGGAGYRWDGVLPKFVAPGSSPTPIATGAWVLVGDATLRGELANTDGSELVGFQQSGTGAVARTAESKLREIVSVKDFGAEGDGITDDSAAIQAAMNYVTSLGGGIVLVPAGSYAVLTRLRPVSNVTLRGVGFMASRFIIPAGVSNKNAIIYNTDPAFPTTNFVIERIGFVGQWQAFQSEISDNGLFTAKFATNMIIRNCGFFYSRGFALNINECDEVTVEGNLFEYAPRDMIAVWDTPNVRVINNILRHNDDDAISISMEAAHSEPVRSKSIVTGNILEDTGPIRTQAPKNIIIANNNLSRTKGAGISVGVVNFSTNDISSGHGVLVANNVITDVIDRMWFVDGGQVGSVNNRIYIAVQSIPLQAGTLPVAPGEINPATGKVQSPYDFYYKKASIAAAIGSIRAPNGIIVQGNICKRTLPAVSVYSEWGYGEAYSKNGFIDYQVSEAILRGIGIRVQLPVTNLQMSDNLFEVGRYGLMFEVVSGMTIANYLAKNVDIRNNHFIDADLYGIYWNRSTFSHQDITIEGNVFDGDPNFVHSNRGPSGTWVGGTSGPTALKLDQLGSAVVLRNRVRNCAAVLTQTGASTTQYVEGNMIFADATASGFSTSNKGVGTIPAIGAGEQWWLQYEDSDPTSATYRQSLGANLKNSAAIPSSGKYLTNMIVHSRGGSVTGAAGSQYTVIGWVRKTTGTTHVLNTDWFEMRCPTGT